MKKLESSYCFSHFALPMPYLVLVFKMYASQLFLGRFPRLVQLPQREKPSTFKFRYFILYISLFLSLFSPKPSLNYRKYFPYTNADAKNKFQYDDFVSLIATESGEQDKYRRKWDFIQNILSHSRCHVFFSLLYNNTAVKTKNDLM